MPASASATTAHRQAASSTISRGCGARARRRMRHVSHRWSGLTASSGCPRIPATGWWHRGLRHRPARDSITPLTHTRGHHEHTKEEDLPDACHPGRRRAGQRLAVGPRARPAARARSFREIGDEAADLPQETLAAFGGLPCPLRPRIPVPGEKRIRALLRDTCTATRASVPSRDHDPAGRPDGPGQAVRRAHGRAVSPPSWATPRTASPRSCTRRPRRPRPNHKGDAKWLQLAPE